MKALLSVTPPSAKKNAGYSLVESLVAAALLAAMFAGAVSIVATMNTSERVSRNISVAYNYQDVAARLWQLGLTPAEVAAVMPSRTNNAYLAEIIGNSTAFGANSTVALANSMGNLECVAITLEMLNPLGSASTTNIADVYRPVYGTAVTTSSTALGN
jgi:type II secretory pathway pseudopilin PulG